MKSRICKLGGVWKRTLTLSFCCTIALLFGLFNGQIATAHNFSSTEMQITTDSSDQFDPSISGTTIVFSDRRSSDADTYLFDLETLIETQISKPGDQLLSDISGDLAVYTDYSGSSAEIFLYNYQTGELRQITSDPSSQRNPAIDGHRIVYENNVNGDYDIYLYDLDTSTETQLTDESGQQINPAISGDIVVWEDYLNGNADIYMLDLSTGEEWDVTSDPAQDREPAIDGDVIAFSTNRNNLSDIYYYRISTGQMVAVTADPNYQRNPAVSGNHIAYEDWGGGDSDIYVYSIPIGVSERVVEDVNEQYLHDISGNRIVYTDDRNDNLDLYLSQFTFTDIDIEVTPLSYDFGEVVIGSSSDMIVSISNVGAEGFLGCNVYFQAETDPEFTTTTIPTIPILIDAGQSYDVPIKFSPTGIGSLSGTLLISSTDPDEPLISISLIGAGVTSEIPPSEQIDAILTFIEESLGQGTLVGTGPGNSADKRINALKNMIESVGDLMKLGDIEGGCRQLHTIYLKMDGLNPPLSPPDFVSGPARLELAEMVIALMQDIGCL